MKHKLVYIVLYNSDVMAVFSSRSKARSYCRQVLVDLDMYVDKFQILEQPLI